MALMAVVWLSYEECVEHLTRPRAGRLFTLFQGGGVSGTSRRLVHDRALCLLLPLTGAFWDDLHGCFLMYGGLKLHSQLGVRT